MNTQSRTYTLLPGQALVLPEGTAAVVLVQGEVLLQPPAQWLGGTVVASPATRISAPAMLPRDATAHALSDTVVVVQEATPMLHRLGLLFARLRGARIVPAPAYRTDRHA